MENLLSVGLQGLMIVGCYCIAVRLWRMWEEERSVSRDRVNRIKERMEARRGSLTTEHLRAAVGAVPAPPPDMGSSVIPPGRPVGPPPIWVTVESRTVDGVPTGLVTRGHDSVLDRELNRMRREMEARQAAARGSGDDPLAALEGAMRRQREARAAAPPPALSQPSTPTRTRKKPETPPEPSRPRGRLLDL